MRARMIKNQLGLALSCTYIITTIQGKIQYNFTKLYSFRELQVGEPDVALKLLQSSATQSFADGRQLCQLLAANSD